MSSPSNDGFAMALTDTGSVYSWGKGYKGRLGHSSVDNVRSPKVIEALAAKNVKMVKNENKIVTLHMHSYIIIYFYLF